MKQTSDYGLLPSAYKNKPNSNPILHWERGRDARILSESLIFLFSGFMLEKLGVANYIRGG